MVIRDVVLGVRERKVFPAPFMNSSRGSATLFMVGGSSQDTCLGQNKVKHLKITAGSKVKMYLRTVYSSSSGDMLNIKRLAVSVNALSSEENWA